MAKTWIQSCFDLRLMIFLLTGQAVSLPTLSPNGRINVPVNSSLTLTCTYTGLIQPDKVYVINWYTGEDNDTYGTVDYNCIKRKHFLTSNYNVTCPDLNRQSVTIDRVNLTYHQSTWFCETAVFFGGPTTKSINSATISVNVPVTSITVVEPVSNRINVTEGIPRRFVCKTSPCRPEATVRWYKHLNVDVEEILNGSIKSSYERTADNLTLTQSTLYYNASRNDMDYSISCKAVNTGSTIVTSILHPQMNVFYAPDGLPTIQEFSGSTYSLIENETLTLTCAIHGGNPQPTLAWTCNGGITTDTSIGLWTQIRLVWNAERDKNGHCTCTSSQPTLSTNNVTINVDILYPPSTPNISINGVQQIGTIKVIKDSNVPATCLSVSKPQPSYSWTFETSNQHGSSISLQVDGDGQATCTASNNMTTTGGGSVTGSSSIHIHFQVLYGPTPPDTYCLGQNILNSIDDQTVNVIDGDELTLVCLSNGNSQPTLSWNGQNGGNHTFRVHADLNYTCMASNELNPDYGSRINMSDSRTVFIHQLYGPKTEPTLTYKYANGQTGIDKTSFSVVENSSISITCANSSSRPSPKYKWTGVSSSQSGILNITTIKRSTNKDGNGLSYYDYTCTVHNSMTNTCGDKRTQSETLNRTGRVNILYPAHLNQVSDTGILEGNGFTLTATVGSHGSPRETYIWYFRKDHTSIKTKIATTLTHYLFNISRTDRGFYTIEATNNIAPSGQTAYNASVNETFNLDVFYKTSVASFLIDDQQGNVTVNENSRVLFVCTVDSNPISTVFLRSNTYNGESQLTESILTSNITQTLPRATCYDTGLYSCIGKNEYTSIPVFSVIRLFVKCTPRPRYIADQNITFYTALGDSVTLNLTIIAYPQPSSDRFKWAKLNGQNVSELSDDYHNIHIRTDGLESRLTITSISRAEFGQYRLTIKYDDTTDLYLHFFFINPKDKPNKPTQFKHTKDLLTETTAVLEWTPGFDGGLPQSFYILYRKQTDSTWCHMHVNGSNVTLSNLVPGTFYYVKMFASNSMGNSSETYLLNITTKERIDVSVPSLAAALGGTVGGVVALILLVIIVMVIRMHRRNTTKLTDTNQYETPQLRTIYNENDNVYNELQRDSPEQSEPNTYYNLDRSPYEDLRRDSEDNHEYGTLNMSEDTEKHTSLTTEKTYENLRLSPMVRK